MSDAQMLAAARLATVLLCGEQSAIRIFAAEVRLGRAPVSALDTLRAIERDEHLHERALTAFCSYLPVPQDAHGLKRRAQRFFASLGRIDDMARHFCQISHLDAAVCKIMWHVENSSIAAVSPLQLLATRIKNDEARHVSVSRQYALSLNLDKKTRESDREIVAYGLVEMLEPLGQSFEDVGVDTDRLVAHILKNDRL